jgi:hypothetical protein
MLDDWRDLEELLVQVIAEHPEWRTCYQTALGLCRSRIKLLIGTDDWKKTGPAEKPE